MVDPDSLAIPIRGFKVKAVSFLRTARGKVLNVSCAETRGFHSYVFQEMD